MPTIRISDLNYQRLQRFAVPLEDTADKALSRVLDAAEAAKQRGLLTEPTGEATSGSIVTAYAERLDIKLAAKLGGMGVLAKEGSTMNRWEHRGSGARFWITKSGAPRVYLPRRGSWPSDTDHKVQHHTTPKSGWDHYDHLFLREAGDIDYALRVLGDLDLPLVPFPN
jgi:hypothetical protein